MSKNTPILDIIRKPKKVFVLKNLFLCTLPPSQIIRKAYVNLDICHQQDYLKF